jgi:hypothetical protein
MTTIQGRFRLKRFAESNYLLLPSNIDELKIKLPDDKTDLFGTLDISDDGKSISVKASTEINIEKAK